MDNTTFKDSQNHLVKTSSMKDEHQIIKIIDKTPVLKDIGKIVCGDTNSNILTFEINRYYDGIDLHDKIIRIIIRNELGLFTENAVNLQYNDEFLRFSWILSDSVTYKSGNVTAAIAFIGAENGYKYAYKSLPFTFRVENTLELDPDLSDEEPEPPYKNWFVDVESRLLALEDTSLFDTCLKCNDNNDPLTTDKYAMGSPAKRWSEIYTGKIVGDEISCADHTGTQIQLGVAAPQDLTQTGNTNVAIFYKDNVFGAGIGRNLDGCDGSDSHRITNQVVIGHYNSSCAGGDTGGGTNGIAFLIGNGTENSRSNAMYVDYNGNSHIAGTQFMSGADYAEYLEWKDRNMNHEDRVGRFVTLSGDKIALANANDFIIGIVSGNPSVIGNDDLNAWAGRYQRDSFGRLILGDITTADTETGGEILLHNQPLYNPLYDRNLVYIPRSERSEWDAVGMLGVMKVYDDGTCVEDGYCRVSDNGIATAAVPEENSFLTPVYKVMKRVSGNIIEVFFK